MQHPQVFSVIVFEAGTLAGTLGCMVCLASQLFLPIYLPANVGLPTQAATTLPQVLSAQLPISAPPTCLDECFFLKFLVVGFPYS